MVWDYYSSYGRSFPWRDTRDPFAIYISEIMLQQTQTQRVLPKYQQFISTFTGFGELAAAELSQVLSLWSGLGYNRRAKFLLLAAGMIEQHYGGKLPQTTGELQKLPGVGPNTAGSLAAFVYNLPVVFIETNIRRVFLHYFYPEQENIPDVLLLDRVKETLDRQNPREWYYALMDLGVAVKAEVPNPNRRSRHYVRQKPFENSQRQLRGRILRLLQQHEWVDIAAVAESVEFPSARVANAAAALENEGFIERRSDGLIGIKNEIYNPQ